MISELANYIIATDSQINELCIYNKD